MSLDSRQWNQIRAALALWRAVAETSRVHPTRHPAVQPYFGDEQPTPLTKDEIGILLVLPDPPGSRNPDLSSVILSAVRLGVTTTQLKAQLKRMGTVPVTIGRAYFYPIGTLAAAAYEIRKRNGEFREKYHVPDTTP